MIALVRRVQACLNTRDPEALSRLVKELEAGQAVELLRWTGETLEALKVLRKDLVVHAHDQAPSIRRDVLADAAKVSRMTIWEWIKERRAS